MTCKNCGLKSSLWEAALRLVRQASFFTIDSLGAAHASFLFDLSRGEHKELDLTEAGVPEDASILRLTFTSQGSDCFAQVTHGNLASPRSIGTKIHVYGIAHDGGVAGGKTACSVTWIRAKDSAESWLYLVDAFEAMASRKYWQVILPAHIAFEVALMPLVRRGLEQRVSKERVRDFLNDALGVSAALNIILPLICEIWGVPRLQDDIRGQLNQLRDLRNETVHRGMPKQKVDETVAGELLVASVFGFEYVQFVENAISPEAAQAVEREDDF